MGDGGGRGATESQRGINQLSYLFFFNCILYLFCIFPFFLASWHTIVGFHQVKDVIGEIEPNQPGSEEDSNEDSIEGLEDPKNNNSIATASLTLEGFQHSQDIQGSDDLIKENQMQEFKATREQGKPATAAAQQE